MKKYSNVVALTPEIFEAFIPDIEHFKYYNAAKNNQQFSDYYINSGFSWALIEDGEIISIFGGVQVSHNTAEVCLLLGKSYRKHIIKCIKVIKYYLDNHSPEHITRFESNCELDNSKAINLDTKCFGFKIVGIRTGFGLNGEDFVLLERIKN